MMKAKATLVGGRPLYMFGLTDLNLQRLREGKPIVVHLEEMGGVGELIITFGQTEDDLAREWADFIGPNTQVDGLKESGH